MELEDVGSRVMADDVEVEFAADDLPAIDLRHQNRFTRGVGPCQKPAERVDDAAAAARHDRRRVV